MNSASDRETVLNHRTDDHIDDFVDEIIKDCFDAVPPKSFFVFAGAGSGKTRSLVKALQYIESKQGSYLKQRHKQIAVITYTNAACDEIRRRLQYKSVFHVATIHSFLWTLIKPFQGDIRKWLKQSLEESVRALSDKRARTRTNKAMEENAQKISEKEERLKHLDQIKVFTYNPSGLNTTSDALSHEEVIKMGSEFFLTKPAMQSILVGKYPYLLIDESQDTKKELIDALLSVYREHKERWLIGMFGDTMQKIYLDGKSDLEACIPNEWCCPTKKMNHRSAKRIVRLANSIRAVSDGKTQQARTDAKDGSIRLFIVDSESEKEAVEWHAAHRMAEIALDEEWTSDGGCKRLILEHHMAAERLSFNNLYEPLNESKVFGDSLRKGEIKEIELLAKTVSNVVSAYKAGDKFAVSKVVFRNSPLLSKAVVRGNKDSQHESICNAKKAVDDLMTLWENDKDPTCISVLKKIQTTKLFEIGDRAEDILDDSYEGEDVKVLALREALNVPFSELQRYIDYVSDQTEFATHQGVKGLEYPRVMVILSDNEERGFLFDYEKLFGVKALTDTDLRNRREGKDNSLARTTRLFYVACTRAQEGLAIVVYTSSPQKAKATAIENGWFEESEIELVCSL